jgi:hypothetical protein
MRASVRRFVLWWDALGDKRGRPDKTSETDDVLPTTESLGLNRDTIPWRHVFKFIAMNLIAPPISPVLRRPQPRAHGGTFSKGARVRVGSRSLNVGHPRAMFSAFLRAEPAKRRVRADPAPSTARCEGASTRKQSRGWRRNGGRAPWRRRIRRRRPSVSRPGDRRRSPGRR